MREKYGAIATEGVGGFRGDQWLYDQRATPRSSPGIHAMVMISIESKLERDVVRELTKLHNITKLHSTSGRYDLCATMTTESTDELDMTIDRIREIEGVLETFSTVLLAKKLDRPE